MEICHQNLNIDEYPELKLLAWNRALRKIEEEEAFFLYERNWRFVNLENLTDKEQKMIDYLTMKYGGGVMNV